MVLTPQQKKVRLIVGISFLVILGIILFLVVSPPVREALFGEAVRGSRAFGRGQACTPDRWNYWIGGNAEEVGYPPEFQSTLFFSAGSGWQRTSLEHLNLEDVNIQGIWASSPTKVWAVGSPGGVILQYDGRSWRKITPPRRNVLSENRFHNILGTSPRDIWIATGRPPFSSFESGILHYNGRSWNSFITDETVYGIWGASPQDIWAVGNGFILRFDGNQWTPAIEDLSSVLFGVWGTSSRDVWAVGQSGTILHYDGIRWTPQASGTLTDLVAIWGSSPSNVWAIGTGTVLRFDGTRWAVQQIPERLLPAGAPINGVFGSSPGDVFIVGGNGLLLHFDGRSWELQNTGSAATLTTGEAVLLSADTCGEGRRCISGRCSVSGLG